MDTQKIGFQGTVDRIEGEFAYVTLASDNGRTEQQCFPTWFLSRFGINAAGDDFTGDGAKGLILLPRRELSQAEVDAIWDEVEEFHDEL